jgi:putative transposase
MISTWAWTGGGSQRTRRCTKPRWVGKKTGPNPTDRAKTGTKRHHLTDGAGMPVAVALTAANRPDKETIGALLDARVVRAPGHIEQHLCLDKGYDYADAERAVRRRRYRPHIRRRGEERRACRPGARPRRWVVERATSWFNRCRKLLIRWEKKPQNYLALVHFAAAIVVWRALVG